MDFLIGQILWVAFDFEMKGFMKCDGRALPINQYQALFSLIGIKYGGDGRSSFELPALNAETGSYQICVQGIFPMRN